MLGIERTLSSSNLLKDWTKVERAKSIGSIFAIIILTSCIVLGSTGNFGMVASHPEAFLGSLAGLTMLGLIFIVLGKSQKPTLNQIVQSDEANSSQTKNSAKHPQHQARQVSQPIAPSSITEVRSENHSEDSASTVTASTIVSPLVAPVHSTPVILPSSISVPLPLTGIVNGSSSVSPVVPVTAEVPTVAVTMRCKGTLLKFRSDSKVFNVNPKMTVAGLTQLVLSVVYFQREEVEERAAISNNGPPGWISRYRKDVKDIVIQDSKGNDLDANVILETIPNLTSLYVRFRTWVYCKKDFWKDNHLVHYTCFRHAKGNTKPWNLYEGNPANGHSENYFFEALTDPSFTSEEVANDMNHHIKNVVSSVEYRVSCGGGIHKSELKFS